MGLRRIPLPANVVSSPFQYVGVYRCDRNHEIVVTLKSMDRPPHRRKLSVAGGVKTLTLIQSTRSEGEQYARSKEGRDQEGARQGGPIDELEAGLRGVEEIDLDEPDVEDDEMEDDEETGEDLTKLTVAQLKAKAKALGLTGTDKKNKATLIEMINGASDEEDEDDEDEEEEAEDGPGFDAMSRVEAQGVHHRARPVLQGEEEPVRRRPPRRGRGLHRARGRGRGRRGRGRRRGRRGRPARGPHPRRAGRRTTRPTSCGVRVLKSMSDEDLRAAIELPPSPPRPSCRQARRSPPPARRQGPRPGRRRRASSPPS